MRDVAATKLELLELAEEPALESRRDALVAVHGALGSEDAHLWNRVDLFSVFSEDVVADPAADRASDHATKVELARNLAILAPLLITWIGIAQATRAYGDLLRDSPAEGTKPFVQLWEEGFGGRTLTFSTIGLLDVAAISLVILLSLWLGVARRRLDVTIPQRERLLWDRLQGCLVDTSVHLAREAFDSPLRFNESLTRSVAELERVNTQIRASAASVTGVMESAQETVAGIDAGGEKLAVTTQAYADSAAGVGDGLASVSGSLAALETRFREVMAQVASAIEHQDVLADRVGQGLEETAGATRGLGDSAGGLASSVVRQTEASVDFLTRLSAEREAQGDAGQALANAASSFDASATALAAVLEQARSAGSAVQGAGVQIDSSVGALGREVSAVEEAFGPRMESVTGQLESIAKEIERTAEEVRMQNRTASLEMQQSVTAIIDRLDVTSKALDKVADRLGAPVEPARRRGLKRLIPHRRKQ